MSFLAVSILCQQCHRSKKLGRVDEIRISIVDYLGEQEARINGQFDREAICTHVHQSTSQFIESLELKCNDCFKQGRQSPMLHEAVQEGYMNPLREAIKESEPKGKNRRTKKGESVLPFKKKTED